MQPFSRVPTVPAPFTPLEALIATLPPLASLVITAAPLPHHYTARAIFLDLQPTQLVAAICVVEDRIKQQYPHARRTGWNATGDGLRVYFRAWTPAPAVAVAA